MLGKVNKESLSDRSTLFSDEGANLDGKIHFDDSEGSNRFKVFLSSLRPMILVAFDNLTHFLDLFDSSGQLE